MAPGYDDGGREIPRQHHAPAGPPSLGSPVMRTSRIVEHLWRGLRTVVTAADPAPSWLAGRPAAVRRAVVVLLATATVVGFPLCAALAARAHPGADGWATLVGLAEVAPLGLLVRYPLLAWRVGWLAALLTPLAPGDPWGSWAWDPPQIPVFVLAFTVAALRYGRPALWTMFALMVAVLWLWIPGPDSVGGSLALGAYAVLLDALAGRAGARRALHEQAELTRAEYARRAALEERARLARELHDVVAHHMSLIAVQAETAPYRHDAVPEPVRAEFASISAGAREALADMRRLLGTLRGADPPERTPQPTLDDLPALVEGARRAGVPVTLDTAGTAGVPATVGLCAYRVVQESLSNAARHAGRAPVAVAVRRDADLLRVSVVNAAPDVVPQPRAGGHGLAGMRERVTLLGGTLSAGPDGAGGFAVEATFPCADDPEGAL